nr:DNA-directed DNA polymerase [Tanacetum cinerariifolium]
MNQEKTTFTCPFGTYAYRRMPFSLGNAPATFQRCMLAIFHDIIEESVEVFMDDFSVFVNTLDNCLNNLDKMLQRYKDAHLVLNWEKCHFMVKEGIGLRHKVSEAGLELDQVKINVILKLPPPLISKLLEKDTPFEFDDKCHNAFKLLNEKLTCALVIISPNWNPPFEIMCDASDFAVGAILGQKDGDVVLSISTTHFAILPDFSGLDKICLIGWSVRLQIVHKHTPPEFRYSSSAPKKIDQKIYNHLASTIDTAEELQGLLGLGIRLGSLRIEIMAVVVVDVCGSECYLLLLDYCGDCVVVNVVDVESFCINLDSLS